METKTLKQMSRDWKHELRNRVGKHNGDENMAALAWEIVGGLALLVAIIGVISMIPEMRRYARIRRM
jgi:hypothetical protein